MLLAYFRCPECHRIKEVNLMRGMMIKYGQRLQSFCPSTESGGCGANRVMVRVHAPAVKGSKGFQDDKPDN